MSFLWPNKSIGALSCAGGAPNLLIMCVINEQFSAHYRSSCLRVACDSSITRRRALCSQQISIILKDVEVFMTDFRERCRKNDKKFRIRGGWGGWGSWHVPAASSPPETAWRRSSRCRGPAEVPERCCGSPRHPSLTARWLWGAKTIINPPHRHPPKNQKWLKKKKKTEKKERESLNFTFITPLNPLLSY